MSHSRTTSEVLSLAQFQVELRRIAPPVDDNPAGNSLAAAVEQLRANPAFAQSRLLARLVHALTRQSGEFRRAELAAFDTATLRLVIGLLNVAAARSMSSAEWQQADAACASA